MSMEEVFKLYGGTHIPAHFLEATSVDGRNTRLKQFIDLFSIPEATLLADTSEVMGSTSSIPSFTIPTPSPRHLLSSLHHPQSSHHHSTIPYHPNYQTIITPSPHHPLTIPNHHTIPYHPLTIHTSPHHHLTIHTSPYRPSPSTHHHTITTPSLTIHTSPYHPSPTSVFTNNSEESVSGAVTWACDVYGYEGVLGEACGVSV